MWLPQALSMDIPYETFWILNPRLLKPFAKAFKSKQEEKQATINYTAWLNGIYISRAIGSCFSKDNHYPEKPIDLFEKEEEKIHNQATVFEAWSIAHNIDFEKKHPEGQ